MVWILVKKGPGWLSPSDAVKHAERETLLYVACIQLDSSKPDYLSTVDVDPTSNTYSKVINRLKLPNIGDEIHHMGWNACSSCHGDKSKCRNKLVLPCLLSNRVYIIDTSNDKEPKLHKVVEGKDLASVGVGTPHTAHCLPDNTVMISVLGDSKGNSLGDFLLLDADSWKVKGLWTAGDTRAAYGYDFWYQPYWDVLISTEFTAPSSWLKGCDLDVIQNKALTGRSLNVYSWKGRKLLQTINLGDEGIAPLEIRFLHDPKAQQGFVGCAFSSTVFRFFRKTDGTWEAEKVIAMPKIKANGWALPEIPALVTDILISMDDRWLYVSNWLHGDVRQYDISIPEKPRLVSCVFLGGLLSVEGLVDAESAKEPLTIQGVKVEGGPQMLQLSLDGRRLYVTNSLFSAWDKQFYPDLGRKGSVLLQVDVDSINGGMKLNENFLIDFNSEPDGPALAHECRYPGGDCSSDIFFAKD
ncbi:methanethiol oxidase isoform X3 [Halyomorpha halys]|uniref:methanethiol oxidase isoform X3 n=1 Tax=Halyomorpha halys TaxID=286706 RepID=UPI0034D265F4